MSATPMFMLDQFVATLPGEPFRLFPFGNFVKGGQKHTITPEIASKFVLPDFKPPIKLGSHDDETPAGGWIVGLEVRADGLYAIPEYTPAGEKALTDGSYRYQSPEVIWEDDAIESVSGQWINGPMILGDALLHTPHLGEQAALFAVETKTGDDTMTETVTVPADLWTKIMGFLPFVHKDEPDPVKPEETEAYQLAIRERDAAKAEADAFKAEAARKETIGALVAELQNKEKFGMVYVELKGAEEAAAMMSSMTPEQREWCMRNFSALALQATTITKEIGVEGGEPGTDREQFEALVEARQKEKGIAYLAAYEMVKSENPDLFVAAFSRKEK